MTSLSDKLVALHESDEIPKISMRELTDAAGYRILEARRVSTKFNRQSILLEVETDDGVRVTFLPYRFVKALTDEELTHMTTSKAFRVQCTAADGNVLDVRVWSADNAGKRSILKKKK